MAHDDLVAHFEAYSAWRSRLSDNVGNFRNWLNEQELNDGQTDLRIQHLLDRLRDDKLNVAFVAEFSRGKSELINAIFFAGYGQRLLPSSAGRTTMCPTELMYEEGREPCIQLLPIETRAADTTTTEYKRYLDEWKIVPLDIESSDSMVDAFLHVSQTKRVSLDEAARYGLYNEKDENNIVTVHQDGTVDIPCWRHAIINFPHPLLKQGLVILDTPGLNAIGTEPELTLNLLPNAHAVLFILAADTGVTKSDIEVWRNHIGNQQGHQKGRLVVLNKIDGLWDEMKSADEIEREIDKQVSASASLLGIKPAYVFPVSAQKGLLAKINQDEPLLEKSRLLALEKSLSDELIPSKQEIVRDNTQGEIEQMEANIRSILDARLSGVREQLDELLGLRGKNEDVIEHMMSKVKNDKEDFEKGLQRFQALRSVFSQQTNILFAHLGMDALKAEVKNTRVAMVEARFTKGMRDAMNKFFKDANENIAQSAKQIEEIKGMMGAMYKKFNEEHGLSQAAPTSFSTLKYHKEIARLEKAYNEHFNTVLNMLTHEKISLTTKFFETLANRVVHVYKVANQDVENWLKAIMSPMETQVREHQLHLRRRLESIKRIHKATDTLEDRITELQQMENGILKQMQDLSQLQQHIANSLACEQETQLAAASA
ncbi:MAG: GTPase [Hydrogenophilales bacterium CG_4_9_14_3_um_filter_59_35]|nr:MAG: GTPase [Hydrogenophilales bacterium CG18_big_fil_WC_8_21_14_2_50_58_12]PIY01529.1 MAG: GTPase [Hydrogenophilales bacterium CG_4_10_14_3_um_filter_58_23]PJB03957.1 MAG: GTPase [Hydrogenophilales bacterium CG_4_9_14_3_um_filter_59_35]